MSEQLFEPVILGVEVSTSVWNTHGKGKELFRIEVRAIDKVTMYRWNHDTFESGRQC